MNDVIKAVLVFLALVAVMAIVGTARAEPSINGWFPTGAVAYIGVDDDLTSHANPFCYDQGNHTGVFGVRVPAYRQGNHTISLNMEHNSCLEEEDDRASHNRIGIRYEVKVW